MKRTPYFTLLLIANSAFSLNPQASLEDSRETREENSSWISWNSVKIFSAGLLRGATTTLASTALKNHLPTITIKTGDNTTDTSRNSSTLSNPTIDHFVIPCYIEPLIQKELHKNLPTSPFSDESTLLTSSVQQIPEYEIAGYTVKRKLLGAAVIGLAHFADGQVNDNSYSKGIKRAHIATQLALSAESKTMLLDTLGVSTGALLAKKFYLTSPADATITWNFTVSTDDIE